MKKNKQTVKGLLPIVGMLIISLSLSGCKNFVETNVGAETKGITQTVGEAANTESVTEIKTIEPPEDGWTLEELLSVTYIFGKQLESPCTVKSFGDDFEFAYTESEIKPYTFLKYKGNDVSPVIFKDCKNEKELSGNEIIARLFFTRPYEINIENVTVNGVKLNDNKENALEKLGRPNVQEDYILIYYYHGSEETMLSIGIDEEDKISHILIDLIEGVNESD